MAVTEITKILFRRGTEVDRRNLQTYGGLAQGEPGFTSTAGWDNTLTGVMPTRRVDSAAFLNIDDVSPHPVDGGGDFFVGGPGGKDIFIGGTSAEKHWQRSFVSLSGTGCNEINPYIDGLLQVGEAGSAATVNDWTDQWDVTFYGKNETITTAGMIGPIDYDDWGQFEVDWTAQTGIFNVKTTCALGLPVGNNAQRPGAAPGTAAFAGHVRYNHEQTSFEGYDGTNWGSLGGAEDVLGQTYITVRQGMPAWSNGGVAEKGETGNIKFVVGTPIGSAPTATLAGWFDNNRNFHVMQDIVAFDSSDERQKDNVLVIDSPIKKLGQLKGVEFDWNKDGPMWIGDDRHDIGVLAQDVEKIIPSAVTTRDDGFKAVDYKRIVPLLIESVKELTARVEELESQK
jgi:hypothetical protein